MIKRSQIKNCLNIYNNFNKPYNFDYKTTFYFFKLINYYDNLNYRQKIYNNYNQIKYYDKIKKIF